jgi:hypothetical protein
LQVRVLDPAAKPVDGDAKIEADSSSSSSNTGNATPSTEFGDFASRAYPDLSSRLLEHVNVNSICDFYDVTGLVSLANAKIKRCVSSADPGDDESWLAESPGAIRLATQMTGDQEALEIFAKAASDQLLAFSKVDHGRIAQGPLSDFWKRW